MKQTKKKIATVISLLILTSQATNVWADEVPSDDDWHFVLNPLYVWIVDLEGTTTLPDSGGSIDIPIGESGTSGAFTIHFEAGKGDWNLFTDYLYYEYSTDNVLGSSLLSGNNVLGTHLFEIGGSYRVLNHPRYSLEVLGGMRYAHLDNTFSFNHISRVDDLSAKIDLWDGFGGVRFIGHITQSISATVRADAGAGSSDLVWNTIATVDWRYKDWGSVYAGYRALDYDFKENNVGIDLRVKGPVIGATFYW